MIERIIRYGAFEYEMSYNTKRYKEAIEDDFKTPLCQTTGVDFDQTFTDGLRTTNPAGLLGGCWCSKPAGQRITRCDEECDIACPTCDTYTLLYIKPLTSVSDSP